MTTVRGDSWHYTTVVRMLTRLGLITLGKGRINNALAHKQAADARAKALTSTIRKFRRAGLVSARAIARELNEREMPTAWARKWHRTTAARLFQFADNQNAQGQPDLSPSTRFSADNPGRAKQKGARDRLSAAFLTDFADDYEANGKAVIETVRDRDPIAYMRIAAALLPTKVEITENPLDCLSDEQLDPYMEEMNNGLLKRAAKGDPEAIERARRLGLLPTA